MNLMAEGTVKHAKAEHARLYAQVAQAKIEWERTVDAIADPIGVFDSAGRLVRANAALASHLGCAVTDVAGRTCDEVGFCGDHQTDCAVARAVRRREPGRAEITRPDGQVFAVTTLPLEGEDCRVAVVQVAKNITDEILSARRLRAVSQELAETNAHLIRAVGQLRATQDQLIQSEKLSALGRLVAGVAHELNNPLTSIIGYAQLVQEELARHEASGNPVPSLALVAQDMQRIANESERAAAIVRNLQAFGCRHAGERSLLDVKDLVSRVVALRAYELRLAGVELELEFEPNLPPVFGDGNQLQQALLNIVLNAEQAVAGRRGGGALRVGARYDSAAEAVSLFVCDDGPGIDETILARVFDPFFTTKPVGRGTGLGLSVCYGIVRDHGGTIWVESRPDVRTTVWIQLPARVAGSERGLPSVTVLVGHTDAAQRDFLCAVLAGWGHQPLGVSTAREALEGFTSGQFEAAFLDRSICEADVPAWQAVLARHDHVPVIFTWRGPEDGEAAALARAHARAVVRPPCPLSELSAALHAACEEPV